MCDEPSTLLCLPGFSRELYSRLFYNGELKISEELGARSGIAISIGQMGRIFQAQKNYKEALRSYLNAFAIFYELNSPNKDIAGQDIMTLQEEIGDTLFDRYCEEVTADG